MPASSQASRELSTASLTAVRRAFLGLSNPRRCLFFAKNSLTDMSRCFAAIDSAVTARRFGCSPASFSCAILSVLPFCLTDRSRRDLKGVSRARREYDRELRAAFGQVAGRGPGAVRESAIPIEIPGSGKRPPAEVQTLGDFLHR